MRDPYTRNAEAEWRAGKPRWQPKTACHDCGILTGTYSRVNGAIYCPVCAPSHRPRKETTR